MSVVDASGNVTATGTFEGTDAAWGVVPIRLGDGVRGVAALSVDVTPANGIIAETYDLKLLSIDTQLRVVHTTPVFSDVEGDPSCLPGKVEFPHSTDVNAWALVGSSADGTWVRVGHGSGDNMGEAQIVVPPTDSVATVNGRPWDVVGNALFHDCDAPEGSRDYGYDCAASPDDVNGPVVRDSHAGS